jgi:hypothetical protein
MTRRLLTTCCVVFLVLACGGGSDGNRSVFSDPIIGSDDIITDVRSVPTFDSVDLMAHAEVYLVEGGPQNVRIEADDNIIGHIMTTVSARVLIIDADADYDSAHGVEVYINTTDVQSLRLTGVGIIDATNIDSSGNVSAILTGVGTISLSGVADSFDGMHSGVGLPNAINAENLTTLRSTIVLSGIGDCWVTVIDELNVTISGIGNVYYFGSPPTVHKTITPGAQGDAIPK